MAILHDTRSDLKINCAAYKQSIDKNKHIMDRLGCGIFLAAIIIILSIIMFSGYSLISSLIIFGMSFIIFCKKHSSSCEKNKIDEPIYAKLEHGIIGEEYIANMLEKKLPDTYHILRNIIVVSNNSKAEIDIIVVGETGVFIIEIKHWLGEITGRIYDEKWYQEKTSKRNQIYTEKYSNPLKQIGRQWDCLENSFKNNGIQGTILSLLFFSNPETSLNITGKNHIPIFTMKENGIDDLIDFIINSNKIKLYGKRIDDIINILNTDHYK